MSSRSINAYLAVGFAKTHDDKGKFIKRSRMEVIHKWVNTVALTHPMLARYPDTASFDDAMLGASILLGDEQDEHDRIVAAGGLYTAAPRAVGLTAGQDSVPWLVETAISHGIGDAVCDLLPKFIPAERLLSVERLGLAEAELEARDVIDRAADDESLPIRSRDWADSMQRWLSRNPVRFGFRASEWASGGYVTHGEAKKLTDTERASYLGNETSKPTHRIVLNLRSWLAGNADDRARLVLHELEHYAPKFGDDGTVKVGKRRHDVEEFTLTTRTYGAASRQQVEAMVAGATHTTTPARAKAWEAVLDEAGQSLLFALVAR